MGRYASVLAFHGDDVVLVRESYPAWGGSFWSLPSGAVGQSESPSDGAARELREETGVVVAADDLALISTTATRSATAQSTAWNYRARVGSCVLDPDDPDGLIEAARWFSITAAIEALEQLPYEPLRVPAVTYLRDGHQAIREWSFIV